MEAVAEADDELLEKYLEEGELSDEEIAVGREGRPRERAHRSGDRAARRRRPIGVDRLLAFIADEFPSPLDRGAGDGDLEERRGEGARERPADPLAAFVFKTVSDPFVGHITMFRVFSGRVRPDSSVFNATKHTDERVGQLFAMRGKEHENVSEVAAGDIGAVAKLQHTHTGDTFSTKDDPVQLPPIELPEPLLAYAVEPKTKGDEDKLSTGLARLREEDPTLRVARSDETHETVMYGMGEAHLDVQIERLKREVRRRGRDASRQDRVPRDDQDQRSRAQGRHVKQTGGHGQYAVCTIEVEPLPRGEGFVYDNKIFGGAIPSQFIPSIEKGIVKTMSDGVVSGNPMVDVKVTLLDGKFHPVDSSDMAFQIAGSLAMKEAVEAAGVVPARADRRPRGRRPRRLHGRHHGRPQLQARQDRRDGADRGEASSGSTRWCRRPRWRATSIDLRSMTGGRGVFSMTLSPLRGAADAPRAEGHRRAPEGARRGAEEVAGVPRRLQLRLEQRREVQWCRQRGDEQRRPTDQEAHAADRRDRAPPALARERQRHEAPRRTPRHPR